MPTARELLEQADALMRRNRERADDDIPVLTDVVPLQEARSAFAPAPRPVETSPGSQDVGDDVPLLTDEVEEIDAAAIDADVDEGEPSAWLDFDAGEPSVIGDAPDSIAIVPAVEIRRPDAAPEVEEFDELDDELAAAIAAASLEEETLQPLTPAVPVPQPPVPLPQAPSHPPAVIAGGAAALLHGEALAPVVAALSLPVQQVPEEPPAAPGAAATPAAADTANRESMEPPVQPPAAAAAPNAANWEAMAEEIRMQVLQRIDLFTDTGLRTQLGARLQPIVDRASADLVATINQHVGELLRAYVAEAIEREIDSWRRNH